LPVLVSPCVTLRDFVNKNEIGLVLTEMTVNEVIEKIYLMANTQTSEMKLRALAVSQENSWFVQERNIKLAYQAIFNEQGIFA